MFMRPYSISVSNPHGGDPFSSLLFRAVGDVRGLCILDVGCGNGEKSAKMTSKGANVYGVEPDADMLKAAVDNGRLSSGRAYASKLQDMPQELLGSFDVVTVWSFCIPYSEREVFFKRLSECIKPEGKVVISVVDEQFLRGSASIMPLLKESFGDVFIVKGSDWESTVTCKAPRNLSLAMLAAAPQQNV